MLQLTIRECLVEMVDLTRVYMWGFDSPEAGLRVPGPVIYVYEGAPVVVDVTNTLSQPHAFAVPGVVDSGPIGTGETVRVEFVAPAAGTYVYLDPLNAPLHRAMGLAGAFVVVARPDVGPSPYAAPTTSVSNLFDDLGTTSDFPGDPWRRERSWNWVFSSVDPIAQELVHQNPAFPPDEFAAIYHPTYFMLNGKTGFFAASDPASMVHGHVGQPALIRVANVGMMTHSPHIHGNHVFVLAEDAAVQDNVIDLDTWTMPPLSTADVLHPFIRPPDAYPWPPSDPGVWTRDLGGDGHPGMVYPMHCHTELSLLANGANYPQGLIAHWVLEGDLMVSEPPSPTTSDPTTTSPATSDPTTTSPATSDPTTTSPSSAPTTTSPTTSTTSPSTTTTVKPSTTSSTAPPTTLLPSTSPIGQELPGTL